MPSEVISDPAASDYLIQGAPEIAKFMYGNSDPTALRRVYHLTSEVPAEYRLPFFRIGPKAIAIRKSRLVAYMARLESQIPEAQKPQAPKARNAVLDLAL